MLSPGQVLDRYQLIRRVGDGGMAHVWAAKHAPPHQQEGSSSDRLFALKIVHSRFAEDPAFRAMFLDEARIVSAIEHPNVAKVVELGEIKPAQPGAILYLVMEYVDGESLFALMAPQRTVPVPVALKIAAEAAGGLHAVHQLKDALGQLRNVVHRDVSPQNILLSIAGNVKLIDFGIAHARDRAAATTDASVVKGKARYMAPEQARREALGPFTDVFGIGATLFRMITGRAPYAMENDVQTMQALIANAAPTSRLPDDLHEDIRAVVMRAIAPQVRDRYATAKELQDALLALVSREYLAPDIGKWASANLSTDARARHAELMVTPSPRVDLPTGPDAILTSRPPPQVLHTAPMPARPMGPTPAIVGTAPPIIHTDSRSNEERARSFMDVGKLAAQARAAQQQQQQQPQEQQQGPADPHIELAVQPKNQTQAAPREGTSKAVKIAIAVVAVIVVIVVVMLLLPRLARERAIATARDAGFLVTIDGTGVGFSGVTFRGVHVRGKTVPGITAEIQELTSNLSGSDMRILGMDARVEGDHTDIEVGLATLIADNRVRFAGTVQSPRHFSIVGSRITWNGLAGEGTKLEAGDIGVEIDSRGVGVEDVKGTLGRFDLKTKATTFGPWSSSFERNQGGSRFRLLFDPEQIDGPSALLVWTKAGQGQTEITFKIPRAPFSALGLHPSDLGLPADDKSEIEVAVHGTFPAQSGTSDLKGDVLLANIKPQGLRGPVDVKIGFSAAGPAPTGPDKPLEIDKTTINVGPFVAFATGTLTPQIGATGIPNGLRLESTFKTIPMQCSKVAAAEAKTWGPLAATLQALGQTTGALRVSGAVNASGVVKYDSASPEESSIEWTAKETCGVSIFGL